MKFYRIARKLGGFLKKPASEQRLLAEAVVLAAWFGFAIRFLPFRALKRSMGVPMVASSLEQSVWQPDGFPSEVGSTAPSTQKGLHSSHYGSLQDGALPLAGLEVEALPAEQQGCSIHQATCESVARSIRTAARHLPWNSTCLVQAASGMVMLRRRGISCRVYLGVRRGAGLHGTMSPHAWLTVGQQVVLGGGALQRYAVVSVFACRQNIPTDQRVHSCRFSDAAGPSLTVK